MKRSPIKRKGGSRFPKRRDKKYTDWIRGQRCIVKICKKPGEPAHLKTRGSGGYDRKNIVPLCRFHHQCQEGKTEAFELEYGLDLQDQADWFDAKYVRHEE